MTSFARRVVRPFPVRVRPGVVVAAFRLRVAVRVGGDRRAGGRRRGGTVATPEVGDVLSEQRGGRERQQVVLCRGQ